MFREEYKRLHQEDGPPIRGVDAIEPDHELVNQLQQALSRLSPEESPEVPDVLGKFFNPIPWGLTKMEHVRASLSPTMPVLDIHDLDLDACDFLFGLKKARNHYIGGESTPLDTLYADLLTSPNFDVTANLDGDYELESLEDQLQNAFGNPRRALNYWEPTTRGYFLAWVLLDTQSTWQEFLRITSSHREHFIKKLIERVSDEIDRFSASYSFLYWQDNEEESPVGRYGRMFYFIRGTLFPRLQHIAYLVELIISWFWAGDQARIMYDHGLVSWQVGWFTVPRKMADIINELLLSNVDTHTKKDTVTQIEEEEEEEK